MRGVLQEYFGQQSYRQALQKDLRKAGFSICIKTCCNTSGAADSSSGAEGCDSGPNTMGASRRYNPRRRRWRRRRRIKTETYAEEGRKSTITRSNMESPGLSFTLAYIVFCLCFVFTPNEFRSAGLTVQNLFSSWLGCEDVGFVQYHIRRTSVTVLIHSALPLGKTGKSDSHSPGFKYVCVRSGMSVELLGVSKWRASPDLENNFHINKLRKTAPLLLSYIIFYHSVVYLRKK